MLDRKVVLGACAPALLLAVVAAANDEEVAKIREELKQLRDSYETRIVALEARLKQAETRVAPVAEPSPPASDAVPRNVGRGGIAEFNPGISAVLQGRYANLSQDPGAYRLRGFAVAPDFGAGKRGFSLSESEVALFANVDDRFFGNLVFALAPDNSVSVEEAYGVFTAAPFGLVPKFGRFFSGLGYQNEQHQHTWDFIDAPLAYEAFLGGQYANDGVQLKWIAPVEQFVEVGVEAGRGDAFPGNDRNKNGAGSVALYAHTGGDIGVSHTWRAGLGWLRTRASDRRFGVFDAFDNEIVGSFSGRSNTLIADFVWKYAPNGNARETNFKLQAEYLRRRERGKFVHDVDATMREPSGADYRSTQSGFYVQAIWQFMPQWRVGARYDRLAEGSIDYGTNGAYIGSTTFDPQRASLMFDWTPSEFSRWRLQYSNAKTRSDATDHQLFVQYLLTLGAHPAHRF